MLPRATTQPRDALFARRMLIIAGIGAAMMAAAGWIPGLRTPWLLSMATFAVAFGLASWVLEGKAPAALRTYVPLGLAYAVSQGVDAVARGRSLQDGLASAGVTALILAGGGGLLALAEMRPWRPKPSSAAVAHRDQRSNDR